MTSKTRQSKCDLFIWVCPCRSVWRFSKDKGSSTAPGEPVYALVRSIAAEASGDEDPGVPGGYAALCAAMDVAAAHCRPGRPRCGGCPLRGACDTGRAVFATRGRAGNL